MFFSRKTPTIKLLNNLVDCHSHILPGVDDGVQTTEEALQILSFYEEQGVGKVIFTPHIMEDWPKNNAEFLRAEFAKFQNLYSGKVKLSLAAEYMLDSGFHKHLKSGELLSLFDNYVLVEMSYAIATVNYISIISEIMSRGYFVVLAHPERYLYMDMNEYHELKNKGVLFQLNIPSILGIYGKGVEQRAMKLLESGMYDILGSDLHNLTIYKTYLSSTKIKERQYNKLRNISNNH